MENLKICWICNTNPADSAEHKTKASELDRLFTMGYGGRIESLPLKVCSNGKSSRIYGPKSQEEKYSKLICKDCNNSKTQIHDRAYDSFAKWCCSNPHINVINLEKIWGKNFSQSFRHMFAYFLKILGCEILDSGTLLPKNYPNPLQVFDLQAPLLLTICKANTVLGINLIDPLITQLNAHVSVKGELRANISEFTKEITNMIWHRQINTFKIYFWYNIKPHPLFGNVIDESKKLYQVIDPGLKHQQEKDFIDKWIWKNE